MRCWADEVLQWELDSHFEMAIRKPTKLVRLPLIHLLVGLEEYASVVRYPNETRLVIRCLLCWAVSLRKRRRCQAFPGSRRLSFVGIRCAPSLRQGSYNTNLSLLSRKRGARDFHLCCSLPSDLGSCPIYCCSVMNGATGDHYATLCPSTLQTVALGSLHLHESFLTVLDVESIDSKVRMPLLLAY